MLFRVDLTAFDRKTRERMAEIWKREDMMEYQMARIRQEKIARFYRDHPPRWKDGIGPLTTAIDPYWMTYFRETHRKEAEESDFLEFLAKRQPMFAVKAVSPKIQVGYGGLGGTTVKRYGGGN